jgi:hypothetical protein
MEHPPSSVGGACPWGNHRLNRSPLALHLMFEPPESPVLRHEMQGDAFARSSWEVSAQASLVLDQFRDAGDASCCFVRLAPGGATAQIVIEGAHGFESCPSGGWLIRPVEVRRPTYWIPRFPTFRRTDAHGRILAEDLASLVGFQSTAEESSIEIAARSDATLDCAIWRLPADATDFIDELERPLTLELQPIFMLASHTSLCGPAAVYTYLVHGHIYENRFDWRRKRKICSELEAYSLYVALHGLEAATGKKLYRLLKQQVLLSVMARQAQDGGWHHGEWTDFMESHYRFHNGAMLLLETALQEGANGSIDNALRRAASVLSRCTDRTDIGLWFFHDSLEQSVEMTERSGINWVPSRVLGKSPATKMILNSHVDAIVTLDRYREVTGDGQYSEHVASALAATRKLLALRPAEWLYRFLYWAVGLTLLPQAEAERLPLLLRALKRLTRNYLIPQLHRVKRRFPRMVMPGGLIERHLSRLHFGVNYHSVNLMDLARLWRRFPSDDIEHVIEGALKAVTDTNLVRYWVESGQRQALGYWVEALYHLCTLKPDAAYRRHLAEAMLSALDAGLGLPPSLLGAHPEIVKPGERFPCPSPADVRLRVANLSCSGRREILVVNPASAPIELAWEREPSDDLAWTSSGSSSASAAASRLSVPTRGWLLGRGR